MERENLHCVTPLAYMGGVKGQATSGANREGESTDTQGRDGAAQIGSKPRRLGFVPPTSKANGMPTQGGYPPA